MQQIKFLPIELVVAKVLQLILFYGVMVAQQVLVLLVEVRVLVRQLVIINLLDVALCDLPGEIPLLTEKLVVVFFLYVP